MTWKIEHAQGHLPFPWSRCWLSLLSYDNRKIRGKKEQPKEHIRSVPVENSNITWQASTPPLGYPAQRKVSVMGWKYARSQSSFLQTGRRASSWRELSEPPYRVVPHPTTVATEPSNCLRDRSPRGRQIGMTYFDFWTFSEICIILWWTCSF